MRKVDWSPRDDRDYAGEKLMVTITLMEYRELVSKAALYDEENDAPDRLLPSPSEVEEKTDAGR